MKIFVTGIGMITGIGTSVIETLDSFRCGRHGMGKPTHFPTLLDVPVSEVKLTNTDLKKCLSIPTTKTISRTALLGMMAAKEALIDSEIDIHKNRVGLISSTSVGGMDLSENFFVDFRNNNASGRLRNIASHDCADSTERIAEYLGISDFVTTISTACSSAGNAIILGSRMIEHNLLDAVLVGGTDALCKFTLNGFNSLMVLDKEHSRPFDESRAGLNLGEGAGYLVLQKEQNLNKKPYCILSGYANTNDAYHQTASSPKGDGTYICMKEAINKAIITKDDISYINVHGTGTPNNDLSESKAIIRLFGNAIPPLSSVKAFIGHTLGASEGIEAVLSVQSVNMGIIYPNLNFKTPITETSITPNTLWKEQLEIKHVLSNSIGFGGANSSLLFSALK